MTTTAFGEQPDNDTKLRTLRGEDTGWTYLFRAPPVCTVRWNAQDWINFIGDRWIRRKLRADLAHNPSEST